MNLTGFARTELQTIRGRALDRYDAHDLGAPWREALLDLAKAADKLDAMIARTQAGADKQPRE